MNRLCRIAEVIGAAVPMLLAASGLFHPDEIEQARRDYARGLRLGEHLFGGAK